MSHRARLAGLALFFVASAAYGSFVPLRWRSIGWVEGLQRAAAIPPEPVWRVFNGDFFTNALVFLPIGFFAAGAIAPYSRPDEDPRNRRRWTVALVLMGSAVLSLLIELGQVYIRDRTPSWSDVYAQALGGAAGALMWVLIGVAALRGVGGALHAPSREERAFRLLALYSAGWTAYGLLPMLFPQLAHPQLHLWTARQHLPRLVLAGPLVIAALAAVPVGAFAERLSARIRWPAAPVLLVAAGVGLLVLADRLRQVSFVPADGHLAAGVLGFSIGWLLLGIAWPRAARWSPRAMRAVMLTALASLLAVIVLLYWAPFDFGVSALALEQRLRVLYTRAPFHRYYWLPPLIALGEVATLTLLATATAVLASLAQGLRRHVPSVRFAVIGTALLFAVVEVGQLYLPARRADPTDVLIALGGALIGALIARALIHVPAEDGTAR